MYSSFQVRHCSGVPFKKITRAKVTTVQIQEDTRKPLAYATGVQWRSVAKRLSLLIQRRGPGNVSGFAYRFRRL